MNEIKMTTHELRNIILSLTGTSSMIYMNVPKAHAGVNAIISCILTMREIDWEDEERI